MPLEGRDGSSGKSVAAGALGFVALGGRMLPKEPGMLMTRNEKSRKRLNRQMLKNFVKIYYKDWK